MHLNEMNQKSDKYCKTESEKKQHRVYNDEDIPIINKNDNKSVENNTSGGVQLFVILLVIVILIGSFILALSTEGTAFIRIVILFAAVGISISLLKLVGLYK